MTLNIPIPSDRFDFVGPSCMKSATGFAVGSMLLTPEGPCAVEDLSIGSRVTTRDFGAQVIKSITFRDVDLIAYPDLRPVLIEGNTFGAWSPSRAFYASPEQRIALRHPMFEVFFGAQEVLLQIRHLIGHKGVQQIEGLSSVTYAALGFARHHLFSVENLAIDAGSLCDAPSRTLLSESEAQVALGVMGHRPTSAPQRHIPLH